MLNIMDIETWLSPSSEYKFCIIAVIPREGLLDSQFLPFNSLFI